MKQGFFSTAKKREIPFDKPIKLLLLLFHFLGFSVWYGGTVVGVEVAALYPAIAVASGVLLTVRELYKDGLGWLSVTEGVLTIVKVLLLVVAHFLGQHEVIFLSVVMLCGLLSSHLPDKIREKRLLP